MTDRWNTIIFDIDGTLADNTERLHHILRGEVHKEFGPKDWDAFHAGLHLDKPIEPVMLIVRNLILANQHLIFITGRQERGRVATQCWLTQHLNWGRPHYFHDGQGENRGKALALYMRGDDDFRKDYVVKEEILDRILEETKLEPVMAFEDRPLVTDMWKRRGLIVAHVGGWHEPPSQLAPEIGNEERTGDSASVLRDVRGDEEAPQQVNGVQACAQGDQADR